MTIDQAEFKRGFITEFHKQAEGELIKHPDIGPQQVKDIAGGAWAGAQTAWNKTPSISSSYNNMYQKNFPSKPASTAYPLDRLASGTVGLAKDMFNGVKNTALTVTGGAIQGGLGKGQGLYEKANGVVGTNPNQFGQNQDVDWGKTVPNQIPKVFGEIDKAYKGAFNTGADGLSKGITSMFGGDVGATAQKVIDTLKNSPWLTGGALLGGAITIPMLLHKMFGGGTDQNPTPKQGPAPGGGYQPYIPPQAIPKYQ